MFPKIGVAQNGRFIMEDPIKIDDLGGIPIFGNTHVKYNIKLLLYYVGETANHAIRNPVSNKNKNSQSD